MIYILSNQNNAGDHNQALGIARALQERANNKVDLKDLDTKTTPPFKIKEEIAKDLLHEKVVVTGAGEGGIDGIEPLSPHPDLIICLTSHMFLERYKDPKLLKKVRFIALPSHTPIHIKKQIEDKLIQTIGVALAQENMITTRRKFLQHIGKETLTPLQNFLRNNLR